jgi:hypothetical protein
MGADGKSGNFVEVDSGDSSVWTTLPEDTVELPV